MSKVTMPKPVGYFACDPKTLNPEWGEECVCQDDIYCPDDTGTVGRAFVFVDQAEAYTTAKVRKALEEAAEVAESCVCSCCCSDDQKFTAQDAAQRIRALIPSTPA